MSQPTDRPTPAPVARDLTAVAAYLEDVPMHRRLGARVVAASDEELRVDFEVTDEWLNVNGDGHGGTIATALDITASFAFAHRAGAAWTTVTLNLNFLRPVAPGVVHARARVIRAGRSVGVAEAELWGSDVDLAGPLDEAQPLALARGTFHPVWLRDR